MSVLGIRRAVLAFSTAMLVSITAESAVLYQQSALHPSDDLGAVQWAAQKLADDFSLAAPGVVNAITWKGGYYGTDNASGSESFTVHLYVDSGGVPESAPFYSFAGSAAITSTADTKAGETIYSYFLDVTDVALSGGVLYWLSIYTNDSPMNWAWSNSADGSSDGAFKFSIDPWAQFDDFDRSNHVFALHSADAMPVIEPSTLSILGLGVAGLAFARRRDRAV